MNSFDNEIVRKRYLQTSRNKILRSGVDNLLCCLVEFEGDVSNGGFAQYFYNRGVEESEAVRASLVEIGCLDIADTFNNACRVVDLSPIEQRHSERFLYLSEALRLIDDSFYNQREELYSKLQAYLENQQSPKSTESKSTKAPDSE